MIDLDTFALPRTDDMILRLGVVTGLAMRAAEASGDPQEKATVTSVHQAIHEALRHYHDCAKPT